MNVRTLCLGILSFGEASGYEIKKMIEEGRFSHFIEASYGAIYPALMLLTAEGLLTVRAEEQTGKPDKKVYAITAQGRLALTKALSVLPRENEFKSEFLFQMLLRDVLAPHTVAASYDKQIADIKADLAQIAECQALAEGRVGAHFVNGYGKAVLTAALGYLEDRKAEFLGASALRAAE